MKDREDKTITMTGIEVFLDEDDEGEYMGDGINYYSIMIQKSINCERGNDESK